MKNETDLDDYYNNLDEYQFQDEMSQLLKNVLSHHDFEEEEQE